MLEVVENYILLKKQISVLMKKSGYRNEFIAKKNRNGSCLFCSKKAAGQLV